MNFFKKRSEEVTFTGEILSNNVSAEESEETREIEGGKLSRLRGGSWQAICGKCDVKHSQRHYRDAFLFLQNHLENQH